MAPYKTRELLFFAIALAIPALFFSMLPWNVSYVARQYQDHFFGADVWRVYLNLIGSDEVKNHRDKVHPYFSLLAVTVAKSGKLLGTEGGSFLPTARYSDPSAHSCSGFSFIAAPPPSTPSPRSVCCCPR